MQIFCGGADVSSLAGGGVRVSLRDGSVLEARRVVLATGGSYVDRALAGILTPCFRCARGRRGLQRRGAEGARATCGKSMQGIASGHEVPPELKNFVPRAYRPYATMNVRC